MSNDLDQISESKADLEQTASPVNNNHTPEDDQLDSALDSTTSKSNETRDLASTIHNNKRKKKPTKSSLLLLKCVQNTAEEEEEMNEENIDEITKEDTTNEQVEEVMESPQPEQEESDEQDEQEEGRDFINEEGEEVDQQPEDLNIDEDLDQASSFESESNFDYDNGTIEEEMKEAFLKEHLKKNKSHKISNPSAHAQNNTPLSTNDFINNRNMELFAQSFLTESQKASQASAAIGHKPYHHQQHQPQTVQQTNHSSSKKQMRFQCRFCVYKSHSVSLMQNHIYRHIDTTPYSCFYCGHKSTTKSTIMVHIELCHPNMEVKIKESRVKEEDYYIDLNSAVSNSNCNNIAAENSNNNLKSIEFLKENKNNLNKFEIIAKKCHIPNDNNQQNDNSQYPNKNSSSSLIAPPPPPPPVQAESSQLPISLASLSTASLSSTVSNSSNSSTDSSISSLCSSPSVSPVPVGTTNTKDENLLLQVNPEHLKNSGFSADHTFENDDEQVQTGGKEGSNNYVTVFNRPKQYFGSLYEPDKQYSCKLCTYTTNHKPSMEDHVYVHTNKRPYRCGYCDEEIYTRYAATYHNKYKHPGEPRNFIKDEQDVSIYYVNRAKSGGNTGSSSSTGSIPHNNGNSFGNSDRQQNGNCNSSGNNDHEESFQQYGVVPQHRVLDSKQRCPDFNIGQTKLNESKSDKKSSQNQSISSQQRLKQSKQHQLQSPSSSISSLSSSNSSPQSTGNNDLIKVTSFRQASLDDKQKMVQNKKHKKSNSNEAHHDSPTTQNGVDKSQFLGLANQANNHLGFNAFNNYLQASFMQNQASATPANNNIASALTQFMLSQGLNSPNNLQSILSGMNPASQSFNSATSSPSSSTNSNSSSLSTSPSTSSTNQNANNSQMYDFNLAIKMYQIQLQNLMTANYLQNFRGGSNKNLSTSPNNSYDDRSENESRKRKAGETSDLCNDEEHELSSYSERNSPDVSRNPKSIKLNTSQFKKSSKHTV